MSHKFSGYTPNHIDKQTRAWCILMSSILLIYGIVGVLIDDIYIPGKHSRGHHFHGIPCWILCASFVVAAANLLSVVVDHYDQRNNERNYKRLARITVVVGWVLFFAALAIDLFLICTR